MILCAVVSANRWGPAGHGRDHRFWRLMGIGGRGFGNYGLLTAGAVVSGACLWR